MLFNTVMILLVCYTMATPFLMVFCIKFGYKMAVNPRKEAEKPMVKAKTKQKKLTKEEKAELDMYENIFKYDGTSKGQKKIEV